MTIRELMAVCADPVSVRLIREEKYYNGTLEEQQLIREYGDRKIRKIDLIYYGVIITTEDEEGAEHGK